MPARARPALSGLDSQAFHEQQPHSGAALCFVGPRVLHKKTVMKHHTLPSLALALGLAAAGACLAAEPAPMFVHQGDRLTIPADSPLRKRVAVAEVGTQSGAHAVALPAVVEADPARVTAILPPLTGRLVALKVSLGDTVKRGQLLALISSPDFDQARSDADKADDALNLANKALERARGVQSAGANAGKDLEAAESARNQALSEHQRAHGRLATLGGNAHGLEVKAPQAGVVTALNVGIGSYINDATATLMTISALDQLWVTAQVPEGQLAGIAAGQPATVSLAAYPGLTLRGRIARVSPLVEPDTRRTKVRIAFNNADGRLKPNMFATVTLDVAQAASVSVPSSALLMNNDSTTVFVELAPWTFVRRVVELGSEDGETVRIVAGLKRGDRVVTRGGVLLND